MCLREMASHVISRLMSVMPTRAWLSLGSALLGAIVLSGCGNVHPPSSPPSASVATKSNTAAVESGVAQSLQRRIRERDKRIVELQSQIAELTSQLEAMKVIDLDLEDRRKPIRPSATLTPIETDKVR